jgi:hypothetical protein
LVCVHGDLLIANGEYIGGSGAAVDACGHGHLDSTSILVVDSNKPASRA